MASDVPPFSGLATAEVHEKLAAFFGIGVDIQRQIGTFVVLFSMIEQQLEFVLFTRSEKPPINGIPTTDRMTVSDRLMAIRKLANSEPTLSAELNFAADLGEVLMTARHTVVHGAPLSLGRLERNRSWFGERRKRAYATLQLAEPTLDAAVTGGDILFRLLGSIGAYLTGQIDMAAAMAPSDNERAVARRAATTVGQAMKDIRAI